MTVVEAVTDRATSYCKFAISAPQVAGLMDQKSLQNPMYEAQPRIDFVEKCLNRGQPMELLVFLASKLHPTGALDRLWYVA